MENKKRPVVLVCPLNWGLGHATRCIPVINKFRQQGCKVVVGAEGTPLALLKLEFGEEIDYIDFPGIQVRYPSGGNMARAIAGQLPAMLNAIRDEHRLLKHIISKTGARVVVSDNRYGLWSKDAICVFITHQVFIQPPRAYRWLGGLMFAANRFFMKRFNYVWVPDLKGQDNLSGILSHKRPVPWLRFTGILTRFAGIKVEESSFNFPLQWSGDFTLVILSGPEPQRSLLEQELIAKFDDSGMPVVFVRGIISPHKVEGSENRVMVNNAGTATLAWLIRRAHMVVCRPGYSTLMDLSAFGKKALLIPTPGQTEQEYLGAMFEKKGFAHCVAQGKINLVKDISQALDMRGIPFAEQGVSLLDQAVDEVLKDLQGNVT